MNDDIHAKVAEQLKALLTRLRIGVQLGKPIPYPVNWKEPK